MTMRYRLKADNIAATVIDGEAIIVNLTTGVYYSMDTVGGEIWQMIEQGLSVPRISALVMARYQVDEDRARTDVEALVGKLSAEDLIAPSDEAALAGSEPVMAVRLPYVTPTLKIYRDMGDLLALDPPMPGLRDIPLQSAGGVGKQ